MNGEAVEDLFLLNDCGTKPGGARGLTPNRGDDDNGVAALPRGICQGAGEGRRRTVCRSGGGDVEPEADSRNLHRTSSTALSNEFPTKVVSFFSSSSSLSVRSSSSRFVSWSKGKQIS